MSNTKLVLQPFAPQAGAALPEMATAAVTNLTTRAQSASAPGVQQDSVTPAQPSPTRSHTPVVIADALDRVPAAIDVQHLAEYILESAVRVPSGDPAKKKAKNSAKMTDPIPKLAKPGCEFIPGGGLEVHLPSEQDFEGRCIYAAEILTGNLGASSSAKEDGARARRTLSSLKYGFERAVGRLRAQMVAPYLLTDTALIISNKPQSFHVDVGPHVMQLICYLTDGPSTEVVVGSELKTCEEICLDIGFESARAAAKKVGKDKEILAQYLGARHVSCPEKPLHCELPRIDPELQLCALVCRP